MKTNLTGTGNQKIIIDYLEANASDSLIEKINRCGKTMQDCWQYITSQARKKATNNCAMIEDVEVYGWAIHYFEEEGNVKGEEKTEIKKVEVKKIEKKPEPKPEPKKKQNDDMLPGQLTIAELFGGLG